MWYKRATRTQKRPFKDIRLPEKFMKASGGVCGGGGPMDEFESAAAAAAASGGGGGGESRLRCPRHHYHLYEGGGGEGSGGEIGKSIHGLWVSKIGPRQEYQEKFFLKKNS